MEQNNEKFIKTKELHNLSAKYERKGDVAGSTAAYIKAIDIHMLCERVSESVSEGVRVRVRVSFFLSVPNIYNPLPSPSHHPSLR